MGKRNMAKDWKCCVTCEDWGGQRTISAFRDITEFEDSATGLCNGEGPYKGQQKNADAQICDFYIRWHKFVS